MITAGENSNSVWQNLVNQSVFLVNTARPTSREFVFEGFGLPESRKRVALRIADQPNDPDCLTSIPMSPPSKVFERRRVEFDASHRLSFATASSNETPVCRSMAARRRWRIVSDFRR